jgi:C4-dicarboxylate-specific signal transduction histidine kinase
MTIPIDVQKAKSMDAATGVLLGGLIGACATVATTYLSKRHAINLQSSADAIERQEKARAFQRDNLLACQEQVQVVGRLTAQVLNQDVMALGSGSAWGKHMVPQQLDEDLAAGRRKLSVLIERVADDELRKELKSLTLLMDYVTAAPSLQEAERALGNAMAANQKTMELLGTVLRKTY